MSQRLTGIVQANLKPNLKCLELWLTCKQLYSTGFVCTPGGNIWKLLYEEAHLSLNVLLLYCWKEKHSPACRQRFNSITLFNENCLYRDTIILKSSEIHGNDRFKVLSPTTYVECPPLIFLNCFLLALKICSVVKLIHKEEAIGWLDTESCN